MKEKINIGIPTDETINQRIKRIRNSTGYNQGDVAKILGIKPSTYSQMERKGNITTDMLIKLSEVFSIDEKILLYGENNFTPPEIRPKKKPEGKRTVIFGPEVDKEDLKRPPVYVCKGFEEDLVIMYRTVRGLKKRVMREVNYKLFKAKKIPTGLVEYFDIDLNKL